MRGTGGRVGDIPDADLLLKPRLVQAAPAEKTTSGFQKEIYEPFYQNKLHFTPDRINGNDKVYEGIIVSSVILDCLHILDLIYFLIARL